LLDQLHSICTPSPEDTLQIFSLFSTKNERKKLSLLNFRTRRKIRPPENFLQFYRKKKKLVFRNFHERT
jgi:hypothetical protein